MKNLLKIFALFFLFNLSEICSSEVAPDDFDSIMKDDNESIKSYVIENHDINGFMIRVIYVTILSKSSISTYAKDIGNEKYKILMNYGINYPLSEVIIKFKIDSTDPSFADTIKSGNFTLAYLESLLEESKSKTLHAVLENNELKLLTEEQYQKSKSAQTSSCCIVS